MTFIQAFTSNVYNLATHPYGCRVLQRCFEYASQEQIAPLLEELHQNSSALMQDQFGVRTIFFLCYVIIDIGSGRTMSYNLYWNEAALPIASA